MFIDDLSGVVLWLDDGQVLPPWNDSRLPVPPDLQIELQQWLLAFEDLIVGMSRAETQHPPDAWVELDRLGLHLSNRLQESLGRDYIVTYQFVTAEAEAMYGPASD
jgi:hypothetical protein